VTTDIDALLNAVEGYPGTSTRQLADEVHTSQTSGVCHLHQLGFRSRQQRMVPHDLTPTQAQQRVTLFKELLRNPTDDRFWQRIIRNEEKWIFLSYPDTRKQWLRSGTETQPVVQRGRFKEKTMLCVCVVEFRRSGALGAHSTWSFRRWDIVCWTAATGIRYCAPSSSSTGKPKATANPIWQRSTPQVKKSLPIHYGHGWRGHFTTTLTAPTLLHLIFICFVPWHTSCGTENSIPLMMWQLALLSSLHQSLQPGIVRGMCHWWNVGEGPYSVMGCTSKNRLLWYKGRGMLHITHENATNIWLTLVHQINICIN